MKIYKDIIVPVISGIGLILSYIVPLFLGDGFSSDRKLMIVIICSMGFVVIFATSTIIKLQEYKCTIINLKEEVKYNIYRFELLKDQYDDLKSSHQK